jgi:4-amino-4-deoxy-L-arabinose transferase-like glycosyltransferase
MLGSFYIISTLSIENKSITFDETAHISSGYSYWEYNDLRLNPQNGLFPQLWLTLLLDNYIFPGRNDPAWAEADVWLLGDKFLHQQINDTPEIVDSSRRMNILLGLALGVAVFFWSSALWGNYGALLSLGLYCFSPLVIAHSRLATSDMAASLGFMLALMATWGLLNRPGFINALLAGGGLGILALSKMSVVIMAPVIMLMLFVYYVYRQRGLTTATVSGANHAREIYLVVAYFLAAVAVAILFIWIPYLSTNTRYSFDWSVLDRAPVLVASIITSFRQLGFLPESYLYGLAYVLSYSVDRLVFAAGHFQVGGFWWFFPYAILVKTPLVTLACILLSGIFLARQAAAKWYQASPLIIFILTYMVIALMSGLNIGLRHLLPIYPMLFILCGVLFYRSSTKKALLLLPVLGLLMFESGSVHPHYLSFFNILSGGPSNGHRMLVDSSLDWGQDLPAVKEWQLKHGPQGNVYLAYFGTEHPENLGIKMRKLPGFLSINHKPDIDQLKPGTYIISATLLRLVYQPPDILGPWTSDQEAEYRLLSTLFLQGDNKILSEKNPDYYRRFESLRFAKLLDYLRQREPDDMLAYSMLVYHLGENEILDALR